MVWWGQAWLSSSYSGGVGSLLEGKNALREDAVGKQQDPRLHDGVLFLAEVKVSFHELPLVSTLAVPTSCWHGKAIAHSGEAWEPGRERKSLCRQLGGAG